MKKYFSNIDLKKFFINNYKTIIVYLLIIFISLLTMVPMFNAGFVKGHDNEFHYAQIQDMYDSFKIGRFDTYINYETAHYFGLGVRLFYAPLSHLTTVIIGFIIGGNLTLAMKLTMYITVLLSGIFAYNFAYRITKNKYMALFASFFYMAFPYRFTDIYTRNAYAEIFAMPFIPLLFDGIYQVLKLEDKMKPKPFIITILAIWALVMSHNVTAFYAAIFALFYVVFYYKEMYRLIKNKWFWIYFGVSIFIILCMISPLVLPMLEQKNACDYRIFGGSTMVSDLESVKKQGISSEAFLFCGMFIKHRLLAIQFIIIQVGIVLSMQMIKYVKKLSINYLILAIIGYLVLSIGLIYTIDCGQYTVLLFTIVEMVMFMLKEKKSPIKAEYKILFMFLGLSIFTLLLIVEEDFWDIMPSIFYTIQFPWRLWIFLAFFLGILGAELLLLIQRKTGRNVAVLSIFASTFFLLFTNAYYDNIYNFSKDNNIDKTDIISVYSTGWNLEYYPINFFDETTKNFYYYQCTDKLWKNNETLEQYAPMDHIGIYNGVTAVTNYTYDIKTGVIEFDINCVQECIYQIPRVYYKGYKVTITDADGKVHNIKIRQWEGFVTFDSDLSGHCKVEWVGTPLISASKYFAVFGTALLIGLPITIKYLNKKKNNEQKENEVV